MGLKTSPGYEQAQMEEVLQGIEDTKFYMNDIGIFSTNWRCHIAMVDEVVRQLKENGFTINPLKCE